jgi:tetratricopeptide (TPR) repeat protein
MGNLAFSIFSKKNSLFLGFLMLISPIFGQKWTEKSVKMEEDFVAAHNFFLLEKYDKADVAFRKLLEDDAQNDVAWFELARTQLLLKDETKALISIRKAISFNAENEWYLELENELLEKLGRYKEAAESMAKLSKKHPENTDFLLKTGYLQLLSGDAASAIKTLDRLEKQTGVTEETARKKHGIYAQLGDTKKAVAELEKLVKSDPDEIKYRHQLAQYFDQIGDKTRSKAVYQQILQRNPDDAISKLALLDAVGGSDLARAMALKPLFNDKNQPIDPKIKELLNYLPAVDAGSDKPLVAAILDLARILETAHTEDARAFSMAGDLFYHANQPSDALKSYEKCVALRANVFPVWENMMTILKETRDWPRLLSTSEKALEWFPNQAKVRLFRGIALGETGKTDDSAADLQQAILMSGNNLALKSDAFDCLGLLFYRQKNWAAAREKWQMGLEKCGEINPFLLEHLGDAHAQLGETEAAVSFWEKAKSKGLKSARLDRKIAERKLVE